LVGPILPRLMRLAAPNLLAMLAAALAAVAETAYVGKLGVSALAGMALVFPLVMLQMMLSAGAMGTGVSSAISRALGAGDAARANSLAVHALWIAGVAGLLYMGLMLGLGREMLGALGGRGEVLAQALAYAEVAFLGSVSIWVFNTLASVARGAGEMNVPSTALLAVALLQVLAGGAIGLGWGPLPAWGMRGVASGQLLAYTAGALFLLLHLRSGRSRIRLQLRGTPLQARLWQEILRVGAPACISPLQTVATILILTWLVARFGSVALAGYGIGARLEFLLVPIAFAVGVASLPMVGMAIGAGRIARARQVAWTAAAVAAVLLGSLGLLVAVLPQAWTGLFTSDAAVQAAAALYFLWAGPCYGLFGLGLCLYFSSVGAGRVAGPVLAGSLRLLLVALGGLLLVRSEAPPWALFALIALAMAAYGLATALFVRVTAWGVEREPSLPSQRA
jgi:putative MATE family efflux protein